MKRQCCCSVWDKHAVHTGGNRLCALPATYVHKGRDYCHKHAPASMVFSRRLKRVLGKTWRNPPGD